MYKKAMLLGFLGYVIGCMIGLCFSLQNGMLNLREALPDILLGGIPGAIAMGSTVVYGIEKWSLLRVTAVHFLIVIGVNFLACFVLKWFEPWSTPFWIMLAAEAAAYLLIWLIIYLRYKAKVRELNELLKMDRSS